MKTATVLEKNPSEPPVQENGQDTTPSSDSEAGKFSAFGEFCAKLFDLFPRAVIMMTFTLFLLNGTIRGHFGILFFADCGPIAGPIAGTVVGAIAFLFSGTILLGGVMNQLAQIQKRKASPLRVICVSLLLLAMTLATLYCAAANLVGIEKLQSNLSASQQTIRQ